MAIPPRIGIQTGPAERFRRVVPVGKLSGLGSTSSVTIISGAGAGSSITSSMPSRTTPSFNRIASKWANGLLTDSFSSFAGKKSGVGCSFSPTGAGEV